MTTRDSGYLRLMHGPFTKYNEHTTGCFHSAPKDTA